MDNKAREVEKADRDAKKSRAPRCQRKSEERLVAPPTTGKEVGPRTKQKTTYPTRAGQTSSIDNTKKRRGTKPPYKLDQTTEHNGYSDQD